MAARRESNPRFGSASSNICHVFLSFTIAGQSCNSCDLVEGLEGLHTNSRSPIWQRKSPSRSPVNLARAFSSEFVFPSLAYIPRNVRHSYLVSPFTAGIARKPWVLSGCMRYSPRLIALIHTYDSALVVLYRTGCVGKCTGVENMSSWNGVPCPFLISNSSDVTDTYVPLPDFQLGTTRSTKSYCTTIV